MENIYVAVFNFYGDYYDLLKSYSEELETKFPKDCSVSLVNGDTLCFKGLSGQEISDLMESTGADYNYSYNSAEEAWSELLEEDKQIAPSQAFTLSLSKDELDMIKEALDVMGDRMADREGYSSGEAYWDLKTKLDSLESKSTTRHSLSNIISAAESRSGASVSNTIAPDKGAER